WGIDVEQRIVSLAVLLDPVGQGLQPPVFILGDLAAALGDQFGQRIGQILNLLGRNVLAGEKDMFIEGHAAPSFRRVTTLAFPRRGAPLKPERRQSSLLKSGNTGGRDQVPAGGTSLATTCVCAGTSPPFSPRPNECEAG